MASLGMNFDATQVEPRVAGDFKIYPPGKYALQIVSSDMRPTKDGTGQYLQLDMEIIEGPEAGGKYTERLNLVNGNQTAVRIAQETLSAICHAVGIMHVSDSEQLHARRMVADMRVEQDKKDPTRKNNRVAAYLPFGPAQQTHSPQVASLQVQQTTTAKPGGSAPPWRR